MMIECTKKRKTASVTCKQINLYTFKWFPSFYFPMREKRNPEEFCFSRRKLSFMYLLQQAAYCKIVRNKLRRKSTKCKKVWIKYWQISSGSRAFHFFFKKKHKTNQIVNSDFTFNRKKTFDFVFSNPVQLCNHLNFELMLILFS